MNTPVYSMHQEYRKSPHLAGSQCHFGISGLAQLSQLCQDVNELVRQGRISATQLVLQKLIGKKKQVCKHLF